MVTIAHVINPFKALPESDLAMAQQFAFETFKNAKARINDENVTIKQYAAFFPQDESYVPDFLIKLKPLQGFARDENRSLPFISEILEKLFAEIPDADYYVYSNADICLRPDFYEEMVLLIESGYDAMSFHKKNIYGVFDSLDQLETLYTTDGSINNGADTFAFHKSLMYKFDLEGICIGLPPFGTIMKANLIMHAKKYFQDKHGYYTFHLNNNGLWRRNRADYTYAEKNNLKSGIFALHRMIKYTDNNLIRQELTVFLQNVTRHL